ncbi:hypothetical protein [Marinobacterium aestuariivivens]|uniref:Uncharacterized protein n=1 Tax=Marinobacterium aestuariivivens TaxID=1698799 RepID=A0ABW1ZVX2_9GAMM
MQVPLPLGRLQGRTAGLAAALRSLTEELVLRHRSHRLLVRLRQEPEQLLINVQDIGDMELPGMRRLEIDGHWQGAPLDQVQACEVIEMYGGSLRMRGQVAQGRVNISLPTTDVPEVSTRLS